MSFHRCRGGWLHIAIALMVLTSGCTLMGGGGNSPSVQTYFLASPATAATPRQPHGCEDLQVNTPLLAPGFGTSRMAYVAAEFRLDYFAYHRWADTPARLLLPLMIQALAASGQFVNVLPAPAPGRTSLRLESDDLRLLQRFSPGRSEVEIAMRVRLIDTVERSLLASTTLSAIAPSATSDAPGGVAAANQAAAMLLEQLQSFVTAALETAARCSTEA